MRLRQYLSCCIFVSIILPNPVSAEDDRTRKFFAVQEMVGMVQRNEPVKFTVMLRRYFIEDRPYSTMMMTVAPGYTYDIKQTNDGFEAYAMFPKDIVHEEARKNEVDKGVVKVRLKVLLDDIFLIVGHKKSGEQIKLYE